MSGQTMVTMVFTEHKRIAVYETFTDLREAAFSCGLCIGSPGALHARDEPFETASVYA
jgi:hypothetical protein